MKTFETRKNKMDPEFWDKYETIPMPCRVACLSQCIGGQRNDPRDVLERIRKGELREAAINKLLSMKKLEVIEQIKEEIRSRKHDDNADQTTRKA